MKKFAIISSFLYVGIAVTTVLTGILLWEYFDAKTYRIVTFFISVIILSNCLAKLYVICAYRALP